MKFVLERLVSQRLVYGRWVFGLGLAMGASAVAALDIENVKIGVLDDETKTIFPATSSVRYYVNGSCMVGGKKMDCLLWGISFSYDGLIEGEDIFCTMRFSQRSRDTDFDPRDVRNFSVSEVKLGLDPTKSRYLGEYSIVKEPEESAMLDVDVDCKHQGRTMIRGLFSVDARN
jgi:hypothetical protein